jgi:hypothetical protein
MKRALVIFSLVQIFLFTNFSLAQTARIIDIKGKVLIKKQVNHFWQKAKLNMLLDNAAEVKTKEESLCTLAFDEKWENILTIKENSHIKIDNVWPANIFLPEGRVFSLINNLSKTEKFQIRTPTAIAGARGTGWVTNYKNKQTGVLCFEETVYIQGMDAFGNITDEAELSSGWAIDVKEGGLLGQKYLIGTEENAEWVIFIQYMQDLITKDEQGYSGEEFLEDMRWQQRQDYRDISSEIRRRARETAQSSQTEEDLGQIGE